MSNDKQTSQETYSTEPVEKKGSGQSKLDYSDLVTVFGNDFPVFVEDLIIILREKRNKEKITGYSLLQELRQKHPELKQSTFYKWLSKMKKNGQIRKKEGTLILDSTYSKKMLERALKWLKIANLERSKEEVKKLLIELI